ncbi:cytochrome c oxidase assembly protein [Roseomonas terrae]|jgi:putative membrane protein|uniref:Cytochrome c oxidase assembly protein n=1 Tax=Neoroseomonas terrae TaxID=424799 RepID=A0ABS5EGQ0_9PROT|nr:cytochrome c oxidase assembly protein [Neoroseomonas terrae]MBR0650201.1 cytochrome c oxidase assembly protein [Neoroseomonas terrae]
MGEWTLESSWQTYCGNPPAPGGAEWNWDFWLGGALAAGLALAWSRSADRRALLIGWVLLAFALVSPLCNLSVALFSARVGQHLVILLAAAPLLALGLSAPRRPQAPGGIAAAAACFAVLLWVWHLPGPYVATFRSDVAYWVMHLSLLGAGIWLWRGLLLAAATRPEAVLPAGIATAAQMSALGAFLTFAPRALFPPHAYTTLAWGLTPLEDQQLGGLLMWVPGGLAFAGVAMGALVMAMRRGRFAA